VLRREYIDALEAAHSNDADFMNLMLGAQIESQKSMLRLLEGAA
jgi:hypothetical protein